METKHLYLVCHQYKNMSFFKTSRSSHNLNHHFNFFVDTKAQQATQSNTTLAISTTPTKRHLISTERLVLGAPVREDTPITTRALTNTVAEGTTLQLLQAQ